jgi:hypothetical protein
VRKLGSKRAKTGVKPSKIAPVQSFSNSEGCLEESKPDFVVRVGVAHSTAFFELD